MSAIHCSAGGRPQGVYLASTSAGSVGCQRDVGSRMPRAARSSIISNVGSDHPSRRRDESSSLPGTANRPSVICHAGSVPSTSTSGRVSFPRDYTEAIRQAQESTLAALADGKTLLEVEFPATSLASVCGDGEGVSEMNESLTFLRQFLRCLSQRAATTRIFFPDDKELRVAKEGKGKDPNAGAWDVEPTFDRTSFQLGYLTKPNGFLDAGLDFLSRFDPVSLVQPSDEVFVAAYPHFDPREIIAVEKLWRGAARDAGRAVITFNAELDRVRTGYYPSLFYPAIGKLAKDFTPLFTTAYYIHNFKGSGGGALFRAYPGPWQVFTRVGDGMKLVHSQEEAPSLKEVALEILPRAAAATRAGRAARQL